MFSRTFWQSTAVEKPPGVTRLAEKPLRRRGIVGEAPVQLFRRARRLGIGQDQRGGHRHAAHHHAVDRVRVDRLVERKAHAPVLEGIAALDVGIEQLVAGLVHAEEEDEVLGLAVDADACIALQLLDVLQRGIEDEVEVAGGKRGHACRVRLDHAVLDLLDVALELAPPVRVALEAALHVGLAATSM
jgi:hypothetical protein